MGIFFTIYYAGVGIFPAIAGYMREVTGNPAAPLVLAATAILLAILALAVRVTVYLSREKLEIK